MSTKYQWLWKSSPNLCQSNTEEEWRRYSDVEMSIIENAYQKKRDFVEFDDYTIDLKHLLQIDKLNPEQQRYIKRMPDVNIRCSREERFSFQNHYVSHTRRKSFGGEASLPHQEQFVRTTKSYQQLIIVGQINDSPCRTQAIPVHQSFFLKKTGELSEKSQNEFVFDLKYETCSAKSLKKANMLSQTSHDNPNPVHFHEAQQSHEVPYRSCPSLVSKWMTDTGEVSLNDEDILRLTPFCSAPFTILSGSSSGVASVGLQNLVKRYTNIALPDDDETAWHMIEPHFFAGPPRIRFEAIFDIIQQYIDPNLSLLDVLMADTPGINRSHDVLATLALSSTVVTTNFDHLIEDAGRFRSGNDPDVIPFEVFCTEEHFKTAYNTINSDMSSSLSGLWKIHGTVAIWKNKKRILVRADEDGGPVATLKRLSLTRESIERCFFLHHLLERRPFIIINYSGSDDFDVTRWLKAVHKPHNVLWIQQIHSSVTPIFWSGVDIANSVPDNITSFDRGLIRIASAWNERGVADRLTVVTTADPTDFLLHITRLNISHRNLQAPETDTIEEYPLPSPVPWQSYIVSGAMLAHLSYFSSAKRYFDHAAEIAIVGTREYCIARLAAAEASIEVGNRAGRIQAMNDALDAADAAPLSLSSWATRKSQFLTAAVKRFVEKDGQAIAITELQQLLNECESPENHPPGRERNVALEAANLLAQLRRYLPSSPEPSDVARQWLESIPKTGLLHTKGMNLHESALNKYQLATTIEEIDDAIMLMKDAVEIREELGHMRGLVASLNVLGSMQMRRSDWCLPFEIIHLKRAAEQFRRSIGFSDKHASEFDQFQARIHLAVCLLRYPSVASTIEELSQLLNYFQTKITDDLRTQIESEFCLAMNVFMNPTLTVQEMCENGEQLFDQLAIKYSSNNDVRLIRILAAARFNSELCKDWRRGQAHMPNLELTRDIITRKTEANGNAYWCMRISRAEAQIPVNTYDRLQLLLDPLSP